LQSRLGRTGLSLGKKSIRCQSRRAGSIVTDIAARSYGDNHELPVRSLPQVRHGSRVPVEFKFRDPKLFARLRIERPEAMISRSANEDQSAGGYDGTPEVIDTRLGNPFRFQRVYHSEGNFPGNFPCIQIHGVQSSPGRLLAPVMRAVPEASESAPLAAPQICLGRARRLALHFANHTEVTGIDEEIARERIDGC